MTLNSMNRCAGMTLVALIMALAIAAVLMLGVSSIYVTSKRGYKIDDNLARQQENSRFSLEVMLHDLRMAGYPKSIIQQPIIATGTTDGGTANNDTISIQYQSAADCLGQATPACSDDASKQCAINKYYIAVDANTNSNGLYCLGNGGANAEVIAENVTNFQILYGIDTDTSHDGIANKYVSWNHVSATDRANIVSVRFALLSQTPNDVLKTPTSKNFQLLNQGVGFNDKRIHRMYSNTVLLRNRMQ